MQKEIKGLRNYVYGKIPFQAFYLLGNVVF